jgi:hypothetical protein
MFRLLQKNILYYKYSKMNLDTLGDFLTTNKVEIQ